MRTLNLGILAHVDAGKTTLTERLLYTAGAIRKIGSVDQGTTQTDTLELERERGITIKSAVASFAIDDLTVNILDTPGHPDFIAEVERVLRVLDGAILVISAVEGVQPQTPLLYRALERLRVPTLIFLNKLDRGGANPERTLEQISQRLTPAVVPLRRALDAGTPEVSIERPDEADDAYRGMVVERLAEHDESLLTTYVETGSVPWPRLREAVMTQSRAAKIHPAFLGSAIGGQGVEDVLAAIPELLPEATGDPEAELRGRVFKIARSPGGDRVAFARLFSGTVHSRDRIDYGDRHDGRVTALGVTVPGSVTQAPSVVAGQIARLGGLAGVRVGDPIGAASITAEERQFPPPALESVVRPVKGAEGGRLRAALNELAEQDPLINVRQDDERGEISVSLYGEVQKEVIGETLAREYGVEVSFAATTTICIERPIGTAEALEVISAPTKTNISGKSSPDSDNPYSATLGLRIEPGKPGSGITFRTDVDVKLLPLYIFHTVPQFEAQMAHFVADALEGNPRLAPHGLPGDAVRVRLPPDRLVHLGLPEADPAGARAGSQTGRRRRMRADDLDPDRGAGRFRARDCRGGPRRSRPDPGPAQRRRADDDRRVDPGRSRPRGPEPDPGPHERRGRVRVELRRLPPGRHGAAAAPPAHPAEPVPARQLPRGRRSRLVMPCGPGVPASSRR